MPTWTNVSKTTNVTAGTGSPVGLLLAITLSSTATLTQWTNATKS